MKKIFLVYLLLIGSIVTHAQNKDCHQGCNITWEEIRNIRNPLWTKVDITPECAEKIRIRRQEFIDDDLKNSDYLHNVACSHAEGWVENNEGECNAGGPPPCCPVQHWHKDANAWQTWKQKQRVVSEQRWDELNEIYKSCMKEHDNQQKLDQQKKKDDEITAKKKQEEETKKAEDDKSVQEKKTEEIKTHIEEQKKQEDITRRQIDETNARNEAERKRQEAEALAQRRETQKQIDKTNKQQSDELNATTISLLSGLIMGDFNDQNFLKSAFAFNFTGGAAFPYIPIITNTTTTTRTYSSTAGILGSGLYLGAEIWPFRGPNIGLGFKANYTFALNTNGDILSLYDYGGTFLLGLKRIKTVFEYGYGSRSVSTSTYDAAYDFYTSGDASYGYVRTGFGLQIDFSDEDMANNKNPEISKLAGEQTLTGMIYFDRPDFLPPSLPGVILYKLKFRSVLDIFVEYGQNYAVGGDIKYAWNKSNGDPQNQSYLYIGFGKTITLMGGRYNINKKYKETLSEKSTKPATKSYKEIITENSRKVLPAIENIHKSNTSLADQKYKKLSIGLNLGYCFPSSDLSSTDDSKLPVSRKMDTTHISGYATSGFHFNINSTYMFNNKFGAMLSIGGSMNNFDISTLNSKFSSTGIPLTFSTTENYYIGHYLIGPYFCYSFSNKLKIEMDGLIGICTANYPTLSYTSNNFNSSMNVPNSSGFGYNIGTGLKYLITDKFGLHFNICYEGANVIYPGYSFNNNNGLANLHNSNVNMSIGLLQFTIGGSIDLF